MDSMTASPSSMRRFQKAMEVVNHLNLKIEDILQRYSINRDSINPACISSLHRRLTTMEAMRSLYLKYAMKKMRQTPVSFQLQVLDEESFLGEDSEDEDTSGGASDDDSEDEDTAGEASFDSCAGSDKECGPRATTVDVNVDHEYPSKEIEDEDELSRLGGVSPAEKVDVGSKYDHDLIEEDDDLFSEEGEATLEDLSDDELDLFTMEDISYRSRS